MKRILTNMPFLCLWDLAIFSFPCTGCLESSAIIRCHRLLCHLSTCHTEEQLRAVESLARAILSMTLLRFFFAQNTDIIKKIKI